MDHITAPHTRRVFFLPFGARITSIFSNYILFIFIATTMAAVTAADIYAPWLSSVPRAQPARAPTEDEIWSSGKTDFQTWWRKTGRLLFNSGLASVAVSTRIMYGILDPAHVDNPQHAAHAAFAQELVFGKKIAVPNGWLQPAKDRANHLNMEREAFIEQFKGRWCTAVIDRIEDSTAQLILDPAKPELLTDPDKLFEAIQKRAVGGSAAEVGPRIFREVNAIKWPTKGVNGEAYTCAEKGIISLFNRLLQCENSFAAGGFGKSNNALDDYRRHRNVCQNRAFDHADESNHFL